MFWTIFLILAVLKFFELITTSWIVISLFGVAGFFIGMLKLTIKHIKENK